jgi:repressor LexA
MGEENLSLKAKEALRHIRNSVMYFGKVPSVRELMNTMDYKSPRSAVLLMEELEFNGFLERKSEGSYKLIKDLETGNIARTVSIPLVGTVTCGMPILAEENIQAHIPVSVTLVRPGSKYFFLKASGDSMDQVGINDGDLILVKQQPTAENGQHVIALIEDEATVKEFYKSGDYVTLFPKSSNPIHQPIILTQDFQIQGIVAAIIPKIKNL